MQSPEGLIKREFMGGKRNAKAGEDASAGRNDLDSFPMMPGAEEGASDRGSSSCSFPLDAAGSYRYTIRR